LEHPELRDKVVMPHNVHTNSANFFRLRKKGDHGTHVAGTALAIANNRKGLLGIAPNSAFMPVQVADANGLMNSYAVFCGVLYAIYMGADVVNVSLGPDLSGMTGLPEEQQRELIRGTYKGSELLWRRVAEIADKRNAVIVKAAGNHNVLAGLDVITRPENIIVVSALDKKNQLLKAEFSNYGEYSTISAPGVDIYSAYGRNSYKTMGGTSMASPIVTGAVALMKSLNRSLTAKQIICILQNTGLQTQSNVGKLIQIDKALEAVKSDDTVFCKPPVPSTGDVQILLKWNNYNDLDLICIDPFGDTVYFKNDKVPSGGQLEIDMNREYPYSKTPIEHIFWPTGKAPHGTYKVYLLYYKKHERDIDETPFKVSVKYGDTIE
jgi:subtilisin family serine protease